MAEVLIRVYNSKLIAKPGSADPTWFDLNVDQATSPLKLDISAVEVGNLGTNYGIGSQQFTLPNTPVNNDFFNYAFNVNTEESGFTFQKSFTCQILVDGGAIASGKLYFDSVTTDNKGKHFYNCTFSDAVSSITDIYKDALIADLDWSSYTHNFTVQNITGSWDNLLVSGNIIYPNVMYGYPEGDTTWAWDANYFSQDALQPYLTTNNIPLNAFKPAVRVKAIWDKIFDSVNYEYESSFISNSTSSFGSGVTASFNDLYMLMTPNAELGPTISTPVADAEYVKNTDSNHSMGAAASTLSVGLSAALIGGTEVYDPLNILDLSTNTVNIPLGGNYRIEPGFIFRTTVAGYYQVYLENTTAGVEYLLIDGNLPANTDITHNQSIELTDLIAGYSYQFSYKVVKGTTASGPTVTFRDQNFKVDNVAYDSGPVDMAIQFGDLKVSDFLKGITEQFNLVWWADKENPKKIYVEPYNTYINSGTERDWSDKVDYAVNWEISHPSGDAEKKILFANVEDDDSPNQYYIVNDNVPFGSYTYEAQSDYAKGDKIIGQAFFAPTIVKPIPGTNAVSAQSNMTIPHIYTDGYLPRPKLVKFKPRLLFKNGKQSYSFPYTIAGNTVTSYYQMSPSTNLTYGVPKFDLNFSSYNWYWGADNVVSYDHYTENDSFNIFWANYINNIYRNPARKITLNIRFEPVDLFKFRVNDVIFIDGQTYLINKISGFDLLKPASTQVELIKYLYPSYNKPVFIVEGNDDIRVPGTGNPTGVDTVVGHEWVFENDSTDTTKVVARDITSNGTIPPSNLKRTLIRQQGFLPSGSVVWKDIRWDKQTLNTNVKNNLQYGINAGGVQSPNTLALGGKNDINSVTSNVLAVGNTNTIALDNKNISVIGDTNVLEKGNSNLLYIGDNSNSGVRNFNGSLIIDNSSGSNNLNSDGETKSGLYALNTNVQLAGTMSDCVVLANTLRGTTGVSIGKSGYEVKNCVFIGNDNINATPSTEMDNISLIGNTGVNFAGYAASGVYPDFGRITVVGNQGMVISGSYWNFAAYNDYGVEHRSLNSVPSYVVTSIGNENLDVRGNVSSNEAYIANSDSNFTGSSNYNFIAGNVLTYFRSLGGSSILSNTHVTAINSINNSLIGENFVTNLGKTDNSIILGNNTTFDASGIVAPGSTYPLLYSTSSFSVLINNRNSNVTSSVDSVMINNQALNHRRTATRTAFINTFSASVLLDGISSANTDSNYIGVRGTILSGSNNSYDRLTLLNIENCRFTGSHTDSTFINNAEAKFSNDGGGNNIVMGALYGNYNLGNNKIIIGWPGILRDFDYQDYNLAQGDYAAFLGWPNKADYGNGPVMPPVSLITGNQYHYGTQNHGFDKLIGSAGGSSTLGDEVNTLFLDWFGTAGTYDIDLPDPVDHDGRVVVFKANGAISATKIIRLDAGVGGLIDGAQTYSINAAYAKVKIMAADNQWWIID